MDSKLNEQAPFSAEKVVNSELFKLRTSCLFDPRLEDNIFYRKLRDRLQAHFVEAEKYRQVGPSAKQVEQLAKSGFSFQYRLRLFDCLKKLLLEVISTKDSRV